MIGTSVWELVFIRACIFVIQYSLLLSGCITAILFATQGTTIAFWIFCSLFALDALYGVFLYLPFKVRLSRAANHPELLTRPERDALFHQCWVNIPDPERYLRLWFLDGNPAEIKRDNVKELFLWAFFDRGIVSAVADDERDQRLNTEAPETIEEELEEYLVRTEELLGRPLEPGRGTAVPLRLTIDVIETRYRSLWWYAVVGLVDFGTYFFLIRHGFEFHCPPVRKALNVFPLRAPALLPTLPGKLRRLKAPSASSEVSYWYRPHTSPDTLPVLFIHGIGIGLHPYTKFLSEIPADTGVIALEILPISMRLCSAPLSKPEFLRHVQRILSHHGWDRFAIVSHSYGSVLTTHILRSAELGPRAEAVVLVDPVSLLLHLPDIAYNFTRRRPRRANEWQLWYFASMDPGTALALGRHFFWRQNLIWKEELVALPLGGSDADGGSYSGDAAASEGTRTQVQTQTRAGQQKRKVAVCLSGRDLIVDTLSVARYLVADGELSHLETHNENELARLLTGEENCVTRLGIEVLWFPPLDHSQVFDGEKDRERVLDVVRRFCAV